MIVHYRMEDKFIHGVTTTHVFARHLCDGIVVIDDELLGDKSFRNLLKLTVPEKVKLYFFGMDKALEQIERAEKSDLNYYIIMRGPLTAAQLYRAGCRYTLPLTCGQQPARDGAINIMNGVGLAEDEIEALDFLVSEGVKVVLDPGGTDENIPWQRAKKAVETEKKKRAKATESNKNTSLQKTINILDCFLQGSQISLLLSEIQQQTQIPFSTCYRLVDFLEQNGYLSKSRASKRYSPGWKLLLLASNYADTRKDSLFVELAPPYLRALQEEFNESACIYVRVGPKMKCVAVAPSLHLLQVRPRLNRLWDIEPDATGFVLACQLPAIEWQELFGKTAQVESQLRQAAKDGYFMSTKEGVDGISSISAPVLGADGEVHGALTLQGPTHRFCDDRLEAKIHSVTVAASKLSRDIQQAFMLDD